MSWLQLELSLAAQEVEPLEEILLAAGAVSISLVSNADEPVLEPEPGETPLWSSIRLTALFDLQNEDLHRDLQALRQTLRGRGVAWDVQFIGEQDWQARARTFAVDAVFADRLHLRPRRDSGGDKEVPDPPGIVPLYLEPGLAFGSGSHPTTRLCLSWLAENVQAGHEVLDFGCGSGVLAIAASLLGAVSHGVDHDHQAVVATRENSAANGLSPSALTVWHLDDWQDRKRHKYDVVVANILAGPLIALADEFQANMKVGAALILSGVLASQADEVMAAYTRVTFHTVTEEQEWVCLQGVQSG